MVFAVQLIQYQIQINESRKTLEDLNARLREQRVQNEELERYIQAGYDDESYEHLIRSNLNFGYPYEEVFVEIAGD